MKRPKRKLSASMRQQRQQSERQRKLSHPISVTEPAEPTLRMHSTIRRERRNLILSARLSGLLRRCFRRSSEPDVPNLDRISQSCSSARRGIGLA